MPSFKQIRNLADFAGKTISQEVREGLTNPPLSKKRGQASRVTSYESSLKADYVTHPARFEVIFTVPETVINLMNKRGFPFTTFSSRTLSIRCEEASIPGKNTTDFEHRTVGQMRKIPYFEVYDEISFTFLLDESLAIRQLFDTWSDAIYNQLSNDIEYYDNIVSTIEIRQLKRDDTTARSIKLLEAWPKIVSPVQLGYAQHDTIARQQVQFNFHKWTIDGAPGQNFPIVIAPLPLKQFLNELSGEIGILEDIAVKTDHAVDRAGTIINSIDF